MIGFDIKTLLIYQGNVIEPSVKADFFISPCYQVITEIPQIGYYKALKEQFDPKVEIINSNGIVRKKPDDMVELRAVKTAESDKAVSEKKYLITSFGNIGLQTIAGPIAAVLGNYIALDLPDYTGMLFTYEGALIPELTNEKFKILHGQVLQKFMQFDSMVRDNKKAIETATSKAELDSIVIDYSNL